MTKVYTGTVHSRYLQRAAMLADRAESNSERILKIG